MNNYFNDNMIDRNETMKRNNLIFNNNLAETNKNL